MNSKIFNERYNNKYDEISSSTDDDEVKTPKEIYCERSPLIAKKLSQNVLSSQQTIVRTESRVLKSVRKTQYFAAIIATLGGFIMGTTLGWTSPAGPMLQNNQYPFHVTDENVSWIAALMPLAALFGCPFTAVLIDKLGRKNMMLLMTIPTLFGWLMIIFAKSVLWICIGRVLTGFASGSLSVTVPLYTSEIADKEIRGTLGTYFQLQVSVGILFTYIMGYYLNLFGLSISCAMIAVLYAGLLVLIPESPFFYLMKGNNEKAKLTLRFLRGPYGKVDQELTIMQDLIAKIESDRIPVKKAFQTIPAKRGLFLGLGIMIFQQFTGCNVVIFYSTTIFNKTGSTMSSNKSTIIVGIMSVVSTYISTLVVDRLGRKILLLCSIAAMAISTFLLGGFFYAKDFNYNVSDVELVPLISLCIFVILYSVGFGPIPWMLMGEIFPIQIKGIASSIVCMTNWFFAFLVTKFFTLLVSTIQVYNTFWLFSIFSVLGTFFVIFIVPETKGKSMEEIQELLGANNEHSFSTNS